MPNLAERAMFIYGCCVFVWVFFVVVVVFPVCPGLDFRSKDIHSFAKWLVRTRQGLRWRGSRGIGQNMKTGTHVEGNMEELQLSESGHQETH